MGETQISIKTLKSYLHKIRIEGDALLAVKKDTPLAEEENMKNMMAAIRAMKFKGMVLVVIVDDFEEVKILNKAEMQKHGWYRLEDVKRLFSVTKK